MIDGVCSYGVSLNASIHVNADPEKRLITVAVHAYGLGEPVNKVFPAEQYGDALDLYYELCAELRAKHEAKEGLK